MKYLLIPFLLFFVQLANATYFLSNSEPNVGRHYCYINPTECYLSDIIAVANEQEGKDEIFISRGNRYYGGTGSRHGYKVIEITEDLELVGSANSTAINSTLFGLKIKVKDGATLTIKNLNLEGLLLVAVDNATIKIENVNYEGDFDSDYDQFRLTVQNSFAKFNDFGIKNISQKYDGFDIKNSQVSFDDIDITSSYFNEDDDNENHYLIKSNQSHIKINNMKISNSDSRSYDGALVYISDSSDLKIISSEFVNNPSLVLFIDEKSKAIIRNSVFDNNGEYYGAVYAKYKFSSLTSSNLYIYDSVFENNTSSFKGGGVNFNSDFGELKINNTKFISNSTGQSGGALFFNNSKSQISNSLFEGNHAGNTYRKGEGGAISIEGSSGLDTVRIYNSSFKDNSSDNGGGIYSSRKSVNISSSTFVGNTSEYGGAIYADSSAKINFLNSSIVNNKGETQAAGLFSREGSEISLMNSLFINNLNADKNISMVAGNVVSNGYNLLSVNSGIELNERDLMTDPKISDLVKEGHNYYFVPKTGSPLIDNGNDDECTFQDQRGGVRASQCDIGSIEVLADNANLGTIKFKDQNLTINEEEITAFITLQRINGFDGGVAVTVLKRNSDELPWMDYRTISWGNSDSEDKSFSFRVENNKRDYDRNIQFKLEPVLYEGNITEAEIDTVFNLNIIDDERLNGVIQFVTDTANYNEKDGFIYLSVQRIDGRDDDISVNFEIDLTSSTAIPDLNFINESGALAWSDQNNENRLIKIKLLEDAADIEELTLTVKLSSPVDTILGSKTEMVVAITDNDEAPLQPGVIEWQFDQTNINEGQTLTVNLIRTGGSEGDVVVELSSILQTNSADIDDFSIKSQRVVFKDQEIIKGIEIEIPNDKLIEDAEVFTLHIDQILGGSLRGASKAIEVTINNIGGTIDPNQNAGSSSGNSSSSTGGSGSGSSPGTISSSSGSDKSGQSSGGKSNSSGSSGGSLFWLLTLIPMVLRLRQQ